MGRILHGRLTAIEMKRNQLFPDVPNRYETGRSIGKTIGRGGGGSPVKNNNYDRLKV